MKPPKYANEIILKTTTTASSSHNTRRDTQQRTIAYAMGGDMDKYKSTALIFYPAGSSRRCILPFHPIAKTSHLRILSINRPDKGETSSPSLSNNDRYKAFVDTTIQDVLTVLKKEDIKRVHIICMCAGTTFALAFCSSQQQQQQCNDIEILSITAIAPWCQPADVDPPELTSKVYRIGTQSPLWLISPIVASIMGTMEGSLSILPNSLVSSQLKKVLSKDEWKQFEKQMSMDEFKELIIWIQDEESGGVNSTEIGVLLHPNGVIGLDYTKITNYCTNIPMNIFHGTKDAITPYMSVSEWFYPLFHNNNKNGGSKMTCFINGSHEGSLFLLHESIVNTIQSLSS